jgi:hypothetical protein
MNWGHTMSDDIQPPSDDDWDWLRRAEAHILQFLRDHYGDVNLDHAEADLHLAQRVIDDKAVRTTDTLELQCLGVVLGNVFATHTSMQWAFVSNEFGNMLALHSKKNAFTLYPLTMISKRVEDGRKIDIPLLYHSFVSDLGLSPD